MLYDWDSEQNNENKVPEFVEIKDLTRSKSAFKKQKLLQFSLC